MKKVCHLSSVHYRYENRIFIKQCRSLAHRGYDVYYVVADGKGDEVIDNVKIIDVGPKKTKFKRLLNTDFLIYRKALDLDCDLYHFHDPELMFIGKKLLNHDKKVIFDIHEEVYLQLFHKDYIPNLLKGTVSKFYKFLEDRYIKKFSYNVAANPITYERVSKLTDKIDIIYNYPLVVRDILPWEKREDYAVYIGRLMEPRGIIEMLDAASYTDIPIHIIGDFVSESIMQKAKNHPNWNKIIYHGELPWTEAIPILKKAKYGLVPLHLTEFYRKHMYPSKVFEYMMLGLVVIITDHQMWNEIVLGNDSGITIPEVSGKKIAEAIDWLRENDLEAKTMSENGRKAALDKYNWTIEEEKLFNIYNKLLN